MSRVFIQNLGPGVSGTYAGGNRSVVAVQVSKLSGTPAPGTVTQAALDEEIAARVDGDTAVANAAAEALNTETAARAAADESLATTVDAVSDAVTALDVALDGKLNITDPRTPPTPVGEDDGKVLKILNDEWVVGEDGGGGGGGGAVDSVNGQTGIVELDHTDVGADAAGTASGLVGTEATTRAAADTALDGRLDTVEAALPNKASTDHNATHEDGGSDELSLNASQITAGVFPIARLATGTPDGTKFVRDDGTLAVPAGGGGGGGIVSIVEGDQIAVDDTDPENPIVSFIPPVTETVTFEAIGIAQTWPVPPGVSTIEVMAEGAGGVNPSSGGTGGVGARVRTTLTVTPGEILQINVGELGVGRTPGYGGGGFGGTSSGAPEGGAGGGASDIRSAPYALADRHLSAAGGGGGGSVEPENDGGYGGRQNGQRGTSAYGGGFYGGEGATTSAGGASVWGSGAGSLGVGGNCGGVHSGGGGAGWYGGSGGRPSGDRGGGGGGSSNSLGTGSSYEAVETIRDGVIEITYDPNAVIPALDLLRDNGKGFVDARSDASMARPVGFASVEWLCATEPTNMIADIDTWRTS